MWITGTKRNILVLFALESGFISMLVGGSKIELIDGHRDKEIWYGAEYRERRNQSKFIIYISCKM